MYYNMNLQYNREIDTTSVRLPLKRNLLVLDSCPLASLSACIKIFETRIHCTAIFNMFSLTVYLITTRLQAHWYIHYTVKLSSSHVATMKSTLMCTNHACTAL